MPNTPFDKILMPSLSRQGRATRFKCNLTLHEGFDRGFNAASPSLILYPYRSLKRKFPHKVLLDLYPLANSWIPSIAISQLRRNLPTIQDLLNLQLTRTQNTRIVQTRHPKLLIHLLIILTRQHIRKVQ